MNSECMINIKQTEFYEKSSVNIHFNYYYEMRAVLFNSDILHTCLNLF